MSSLYFNIHQWYELLALLLVIISVITVIEFLLIKIFGYQKANRFITILIFSLVSLTIYGILMKSNLFLQIERSIRLFALAATIFLFTFATIKLSFESIHRAHIHTMQICAIFLLTPFIASYFLSAKLKWPATENNLAGTYAIENSEKSHSIFIILDELSSVSVDEILPPLYKSGYSVTVQNYIPAGQNTVSAIPAMFMGKNFNDSSPCGPYSLCSGTSIIDFSQIRATRADIDVVGFFHRYCKIQGLRSCFDAPLSHRNASADFFCRNFIVPEKIKSMCDQDILDRDHYYRLRDTMSSVLLDSQFWTKGGLLFAHLMAPHPIIGDSEGTLDDHYEKNLAYTRKLIQSVVEKINSSEFENIKIIITSDHPLRYQDWCNKFRETLHECLSNKKYFSQEVPAIVAQRGNPVTHSKFPDEIINIFALFN